VLGVAVMKAGQGDERMSRQIGTIRDGVVIAQMNIVLGMVQRGIGVEIESADGGRRGKVLFGNQVCFGLEDIVLGVGASTIGCGTTGVSSAPRTPTLGRVGDFDGSRRGLVL
jgi:hypothetical protein